MKISYLLALSLVSAVVVGQPSHPVVAVAQSSINLTTSFNPDNVKEITWTFKTKQGNDQIIKIQNGRVEYRNNRYNPSHHGIILGINNLTKNDSGLYTSEITMWNNSMKEEKFYVTVVDEEYEANTRQNKNMVEEENYKNKNEEGKESGVNSNTRSIIIGVAVSVPVLVVVGLVAFLVWKFKFSKKSSNTCEQDNQDEEQAAEGENMVKEHQNHDEHQNDDNAKYSIHDTKGHKRWANSRDQNKVKKHEEDEHWNRNKNEEIQLQETKSHKRWANSRDQNKVKKHEEDEHWNRSKNEEIQLQETSNWGDRVQNNEVETQEKEDEENTGGCPLLEETDATTASENRSTESNLTDMMSSACQRLMKDM